jgi:hypothetical protein
MLAAVVAAHVVVVVAWAHVVPPWEGPDEPAHLLRVRQLACRLGWSVTGACGPDSAPGDAPVLQVATGADACSSLQPSPTRDLGDWSRSHLLSSYQSHQPPLGHLPYVPLFLASGPHRPPIFVDTRYSPTDAGIFLHDQDRGPLLGGTVRRLRLLRLAGLLFSILTVLAAWRCASYLAPRQPGVGVLAAAMAAFLPQFTFTAAYVNNDMVAAAAGGALTAWVVSALAAREGLPPGWATVCMALMALAVGARLNVLGLVPFVALSLAVLAVKHRARRLFLLLAVGIVLGGLALVWVMRSTAPWAALLRQRWAVSPRLDLQAALASIGRSFVGELGWMSVRLPDWAYLGAAAAGLALVLLVILQLFLRPARPSRDLAVLLVLGALSMLVTVVVDALLSGQAQGRYLFPALALLAALAGLGGCGLLGARTGLRVAGLVSMLLLAGNLSALLGRVAPAYRPAASGMLSTVETPHGPVLVQHGMSTQIRSGFPADALGQVIVAAPETGGVELDGLLVGAEESQPVTLCRGQRAVHAPWVLAPGGALVLQMPASQDGSAEPRIHFSATEGSGDLAAVLPEGRADTEEILEDQP